MRVHLYTTFWNEMAMLGFFFRHYEPWVERFVCFDDGSTDGSREYLLSKRNVEVRPFPRAVPDSFNRSKKMLFDNCWKESRGSADWVIVLDIDEFLCHPSIEAYLQSCRQRGITCIPSLGFEIITDTFPDAEENLARSRTRGAPNRWYCKLGLFDPEAIDGIDLMFGSHSAKMTGRVILPERDELLLLHYKKLGFDYFLPRTAALRARRGSRDVAEGLGHHYRSPGEMIDVVNRQRGMLMDVADPTIELWRDYPEPRWWRLPPEQPPRAPLSGWARFWDRQMNSIRKRLPRLS
jgi:glycosyltransferase involved in cell wall biosynthesis